MAWLHPCPVAGPKARQGSDLIATPADRFPKAAGGEVLPQGLIH